MAVTFTSWTASDDPANPAIAWDTVADVQHWPLYIHAEAVRQAIVERLASAAVSYSGVLATALAADTPTLATWGAEVDARVTALIPLYINHTDNSGNWDGQATCAPHWTEGALLAALGESRLSYNTSGLSAAWAKQQHDILNLLRWTDERDYWGYANMEYRRGQAFDDASALAAWNAAAWVSGVPTPWDHISAGMDASIWYVAWRTRAQITIPYIPTGRRHAADLYVLPGNPTIGAFDSEGLGYVENAWKKLESFAPADVASRTSAVYGNIATNPPNPSKRGWSFTYHQGEGYPDPRLVIRWDVAGGFTFQ